MKLVDVPQWVRAKAQVPPDERLASRSEANSTCTPSNGSAELEGTRMQAACGRPEQGRVVDTRISCKAVVRGKPTVSSGRKAAVLGARRRVPRTPPGSKSGACIGVTRGRGRAICLLANIPGLGARATKGPGAVGGLRPDGEPVGDTTHARKRPRDRGASDKRSVSKRTGWQSSRNIGPGKEGTQGPRDPREGR